MPTFSAYDGTELAYHLKGEGPGEPLVCLPGGPMRASAYLGDLGGLSAYRPLVLLDLRGTGDSAVPADPSTYRCDRLVADVEALREHLGLERMDLLGHSASGNLATLYAAAHPYRLRSLVLVAPGLRAAGVDVTEADVREAVELRAGEPWYPRARAATEEVWSGARGLREVWDDVIPFAYGRWDADARAHAAAEPGQVNREAAAAYYAPGAFDPPTTVAALAAVDAPVLVATGELDTTPRPRHAAELAGLFPAGETAVQPGAGHIPWLDDAGRFTRTVGAFLTPGVRTVTAAGTRLAYRVWGAPEAAPVLLLHGRCGGGEEWARIAAELAATHRVYAPDLRGHRLSDWPGGYGFETLRDDARAFLDALGLERVDVVGHSLGGAVACLLARSDPHRVERVVLEDPAPPFPLSPPRPPARRADYDPVLDFDWDMIAATDADLNEPDPAWAAGLPGITAPVLVVGGGPASHVPQERLARMAELIPAGRFLTIDAGHLVHRERPAEFLAALRDFGL